MGPEIDRAAQAATYAQNFTDTALKLANFAPTLWGFHITVLVAAMGWAVSSRTWKKGLSPQICVVTGVALLCFGFANLWSVAEVYGRMNAALHIAKAEWDAAGFPQRTDDYNRLYGDWGMYRAVYVALDVAVALIVPLLLSKFGRASAQTRTTH